MFGFGLIANADGKYITATTTLNSYIRYVAELKGTKAMCLEGGCGSCVVTAEIINPITRRKCLLAVNSVSSGSNSLLQLWGYVD